MPHRSFYFPLITAIFFVPCVEADITKDLLHQAEQQAASKNAPTGSADLPMDEGPFSSSWESPGWTQYRLPQWLQDAKFGVFLHWGPSSVEGHYGWPFHQMYLEGKNQKTLSKYGHPSEFGYKDLIPLWTAKDWNPDKMTAFFKRVGFRYIVPVARHHDNFDLWDSTYHPWNSKRMGPKRDIIGEFKAAATMHGLRFGVSDHPEQTGLMKAARRADTKGDKAGVHYDGWLTQADGKGKWWEGEDPQKLYVSPDWPTPPWIDNWYLRTKELLDRYEPDYFYFDGGIPFGESGMRLVAHYFNRGRKRHAGKDEVVLSVKRIAPQEALVLGYEIGKSDKLLPFHWQSDTTLVGAWFHAPGGILYTPSRLVTNLVDVISKNGSMLLNVALTPEGILPENQRECLEGTGAWLAQNAEAIYGTRPWKIYGEGPTSVRDGPGGKAWQDFTAKDIRFTQKDGKLYVLTLGIPEDKELRVPLLSKPLGGSGGLLGSPIKHVKLLGSTANLQWTQPAGKGLQINLPHELPNQLALVFRITCEAPIN
jgi:alpha-L-fucosidase